MKIFVLKCDDGFTLLEALMGMFIMAVITLLFLQMTIMINFASYDMKINRDLMLFTMQIQRDLIKSENATGGEQLNLNLTDDEKGDISYKMSGNKLIRQAPKGGETSLVGVKEIKFSLENKVIYMEVQFEEKSSIKIPLGKANS